MLPTTLTPEQQAQWIRQHAKDSFDDVIKDYFTEEEMIDMKHQSFLHGKELNELEAVKAQILEHLNKGSLIELTIDLPTTDGINDIKKKRKQLDQDIARGYSERDVKVYAIAGDDGFMHYFDLEGNEFESRKRSLSQRERHEHFGMFDPNHKLEKQA